MGKLVDAGADVTVVAPELIPEVATYVDDGRARLRHRPFADGDTRGFELVMIATDDGAVNRRVADEARAQGILMNAADDVENCDFILPSLVRRGEIAVASSTGGTSPAMARWLRGRSTTTPRSSCSRGWASRSPRLAPT
ncbi:MAG: bifunctional precorrin-2 dehydrogenase/sirohydrochlorin ferrochelatase [Chloroflexi bacterium]|nr:bifunctional precorrin-2 dehydrogenase/sirohydrochlorin ferrochelatase [Chloroflexota bacterium]